MKNTAIKLSALLLSLTGMQASAEAPLVDLDNKYAFGSMTFTDYDGLGDATGIQGGLGLPVNLAGHDTAIEVGYAYLGEYSESVNIFGSNFDVSLYASSLYGAYRYNHKLDDKIKVFGKAGLNLVTATAESGGNEESDSEVKLYWGLGGSYAINEQMDGVVEYVSYASDISALQFGVNYKF